MQVLFHTGAPTLPVPSPLYSGEKVADRPDEGAFSREIPARHAILFPPHPIPLPRIVCGQVLSAGNRFGANDSGERGQTIPILRSPGSAWERTDPVHWS